MAGLFDPSMFPNAMGSGAPQMGLLARLAGMINQPTSQAPGFQGTPNYMDTAQWPVGPMGAPSGNAMAQGLIPPQGPSPGQPSPPMPQMPQGAPPNNGFLDALTGFLGNHSNALMGLGAGIATGGGMGAAAGLAHGSDTDYQRNLQQSSLAGTYQALLASGIPAAQAQAMTLNPELLKTMAPTYMAKPTFGVIGQSPTGIPQYGWINSNTQQTTPASGGGGGPPGGQGTGVDDPSLTGPAYLDAIRNDPRFGPQKADQIQGILAGKQPYPSGFLLKTPFGQWLTGAISQAEPGFNAQTYQQRQHAFNDWYGGGPDQNVAKNLNQFLGHTSSLVANVTKLDNGQIPAWNYVTNTVGGALGKATNLNPTVTDAHAAADELAALFKGKGISDTEIKQWSQSFRQYGSPAQQKEDVGALVDLAEKSFGALEKKRQDAFGPAVAAQLPPIIDQKTQAVLDGIKTWAHGAPAAAPTATQATGGTPDAQGWITLPGGVKIREKK